MQLTPQRLEYSNAPSLCSQCQKELPFRLRKNKFCSRSCAATYNNFARPNNTVSETWICLNCNKSHLTVAYKPRKYCSVACQKEHENTVRIEQWLSGGPSWNLQTPGWAKSYIKSTQGTRCAICELSTWQGHPITLEVDHINGNPHDNVLINLRLLCPNCHSATDSFKGRNRGNGRINRYK